MKEVCDRAGKAPKPVAVAVEDAAAAVEELRENPLAPPKPTAPPKELAATPTGFPPPKKEESAGFVAPRESVGGAAAALARPTPGPAEKDKAPPPETEAADAPGT